MKVNWDGPHPDEGSIHAWLDGEIDAADAALLEAHVADCAQCTSAVAEARGLVAGASRVVGMLDDAPPALIRNAAAPTPVRATDSSGAWRFLRVTPARAAIAATLIVVAGITFTRRHGAFDAVAPKAALDSSMVATAEPAATPTGPQDHLLDSAIQRKLMKDQPPRTVSAAPGVALPSAPAPAVLGEIAANATAQQQVAAARTSLRAQNDSGPVRADRTAAGLSAPSAPASAQSNAIIAAKAAESTIHNRVDTASVANTCLRLESVVPNAQWGAEKLPVTLVFDATGRNARVFSSTGQLTNASSFLASNTPDSSRIALRRIGYSGAITLAGAGPVRSGLMRSSEATVALSEVVVAADAERRDFRRATETRDTARARAAIQARSAAAPAEPATPVVPITARRVACPTG